jgi:anti-sigma regulatory factor (Ser/Thr protein kinase)
MSPTQSFQLIRSSRAPGIARDHVREFLAANGAGVTGDANELEFTSALLTSELVTHAVEHADHHTGDVQLVLDFAAHTLHAEISLDDVALPIAVPRSEEREIMYGLAIIESVASRWGGNRTGHGTRLWFELDARCIA